MKFTEDFEEIVDLRPLTTGEVLVTPSGLVLQLLEVEAKRSPEKLRKPSGTFRSHASQYFAGDQPKMIFGTNELVVGDGAHMKITFLEPAKNLRFQYYQVPDYTSEDIAFTGKAFKDMSAADLNFFFRAFHDRQEKVHMQVPQGFTEIRWGEYTAGPFTSVVFENNLIGSLHIDQISWEN